MKWAARLDAYGRAEEHLTTQTLGGAVVSIVGFSLMAVLLIAECYHFATPPPLHEMTVDGTRGEKLAIHLNLTFPALPCALLSLDALDASGKHECFAKAGYDLVGCERARGVAHPTAGQVDIDTTLYKSRLGADGRIWSSERVNLTDGAHEHDDAPKAGGHGHSHGHDHSHAPAPAAAAPDKPARTFHSLANSEAVKTIQKQLDSNEGCNIAGYLEVERVGGNFHISVHSQSFHVLDQVLGGDASRLNVSHIIHSLAFGPEYPGMNNPLDHTARILSKEEGTGTFKYFLKVVPTTYSSSGEPDIPTNQFSVTEYFMSIKGKEQQLPAVYFMYDLYPITVQIHAGVRSWSHLLTRVCAVVGGVFAVTGLFDKWVHGVVTALTKTE